MAENDSNIAPEESQKPHLREHINTKETIVARRSKMGEVDSN